MSIPFAALPLTNFLLAFSVNNFEHPERGYYFAIQKKERFVLNLKHWLKYQSFPIKFSKRELDLDLSKHAFIDILFATVLRPWSLVLWRKSTAAENK